MTAGARPRCLAQRIGEYRAGHRMLDPLTGGHEDVLANGIVRSSRRIPTSGRRVEAPDFSIDHSHAERIVSSLFRPSPG
jgi:hypothetical protein